MTRYLRSAELWVAALVIAVVAMLIVPLPRPLLDGLLVLNIAVAVCLVMAAVFSPRPLHFASFPTLLVLTTLFRVGLEVSATRLVLADGDAGAVVAAFGSSVVAGSLIVGLVVFVVITLVQLIVVARGAERVAEVAARFALDAMPGKQMAIDAELRAGTLDGDAARRRRDDLERESNLYGAMDGAMRFVKGDAIAAIIIVAVNLVGGLAIGVGKRGMALDEAITTYSLLSIGEGLVNQIPSLLVAVAAGLLVTRVAAAGDRAVAADLAPQLPPRALVAAAVLLGGLGLVPGLPFTPFALLAVAAAAGAYVANRAQPRAQAVADELSTDIVRAPRPRLVLGRAFAGVPRDQLHRELAELRRATHAATGVPIPPFAIEIASAPSDGGELDVELAIDHTAVSWPTVAATDELASALAKPLAAIAPDLLGVDRTAALVDRAAEHAPLLVREVVPKLITLAAVSELLRDLVREGIPIHDVAAVLDAIARAPEPVRRDLAALADHVRGQLRRQISARFAPRGELAVFTVDAMIEDAVRTSIDRRDGKPILAIEPAIAHDIVAAVRNQLGARGVILASSDIRRHLRSLLELELPEVAVLAAHELVPGTSVRTAGRIEVA